MVSCFQHVKRTVLQNLFVKIVLFLYIHVFDEISFSLLIKLTKGVEHLNCLAVLN